jgi:hypothetical protein
MLIEASQALFLGDSAAAVASRSRQPPPSKHRFRSPVEGITMRRTPRGRCALIRSAVRPGPDHGRIPPLARHDLVLHEDAGAPLMAGLPVAAEVIAHNQTTTSIRTTDGPQVDPRVGAAAGGARGAALRYVTGAKAHNIRRTVTRRCSRRSGRARVALSGASGISIPGLISVRPASAVRETTDRRSRNGRSCRGRCRENDETPPAPDP